MILTAKRTQHRLEHFTGRPIGSIRRGRLDGAQQLPRSAQSAGDRLPGSCCSTATRTSFGNRRAQVAKNTPG